MITIYCHVLSFGHVFVPDRIYPGSLYPAASIFLSNSASVIPLCSDATCLLFIEKLTHPVKKSCLLILLLEIKSTIRKNAHIGNHSQYEHFLFRHSQAFSGLLLGLLYQKLIYFLHQISIRVTFFFRCNKSRKIIPPESSISSDGTNIFPVFNL